MKRISRRTVLGGGGAAGLGGRLFHPSGMAPGVVPPAIVDISPHSGSFAGGAGSAGDPIATMSVVLLPSTPAFTGTFSLTGTHASLFTIGASSGVLAVGASDVADGTYNFNVVATQAGLTGSPFTQAFVATGSSGVVMLPGTVYPNISGSQVGTGSWVCFITNPTPITGTVTLSVTWFSNPPGTIKGYWTIDGTKISGSDFTDATATKPCSFSWNSTTVADGTHILYPRFTDWTDDSAYKLQQHGHPRVVANSGFLTGTQTVAVAHGGSLSRVHNPRPDLITYEGVPNPAQTTYPLSTTFIAPSSSPTLRNTSAWMHETVSEGRMNHYSGNPAWVTNTTGGVWVYFHHPYFSLLIDEVTYQFVETVGDMDGGRLNCTTNPYITAVEYPDGSGWLVIDIGARLAKIGFDGTITTVHGYRRNRSLLSWDPDYSYSDALRESKREYVGTTPGAPPGFPGDEYELATGVDVCFDPRNSNICYVVCQLRHIIFRIDLSTSNMTVYAGAWKTPGNANAAGTGATNARFHDPVSILMSDGTGNKGPIGTMYVADAWNYKIRKISPDGLTVTDVVGQGWFPESNQSAAVVHSVTSMTWAAGTATIVLATASTVAGIGQTVFIQGASATGGGTVNGSFLITTFTDSQHFTVAMPGTALGTISGTITCKVYKGYVYSPGKGVSVPFASAFTVWPAVMRWTSAGNIVLGEGWNLHVRLVNLAAQTITQIGMFNGQYENGVNIEPWFGEGISSWFWLDCDYVGACGPVDDIRIFQPGENREASHIVWLLSLDGTVSQEGGSDASNLPLLGQSGPGGTVTLGIGHYPWAIAMSRHQARMISGGFATNVPVQWRAKQASDPDVSVIAPYVNFDNTKFQSGYEMQWTGTPRCFPWGARPAFWALWGEGTPHLGNRSGANTFNDLMVTYPTDAALAAYIQAGMGGSVARPEMTGNDLRDYIYYVRRNTLAGSQTPVVQPGADAGDTSPPIVLSLTATRLSATSIRVDFTTNESAICIAGAGSPGQQAFSFCPYPVFSEIETGYSTTHSITINNLPSGATPIHYTVVVKDVAGNFAHTANQTVV